MADIIIMAQLPRYPKGTQTAAPLISHKYLVDIISGVWYNSSMVDDTDTVKAKHGEVYILHFAKPYWSNARGGCRHYVGYTTIGATERIKIHKAGKGSLLVDYAANKHHIPFEIGLIQTVDLRGEPLTKQGARDLERRFKGEGHLSRHCEICRKEK